MRIEMGGICFVIGVILITLKLAGVIAWPWLAVTAPLWLPLAGLLIILTIMLLIGIAIGINCVVNYFIKK